MKRNPWPKGKSRKRSQAAKKAWETRNSRSGRAKRAWKTRRKNENKAKDYKRLTKKQQADIVFELWDGTPVAKIAKMFNISAGQVSYIGRKNKMPGKRGRPKTLRRA